MNLSLAFCEGNNAPGPLPSGSDNKYALFFPDIDGQISFGESVDFPFTQPKQDYSMHFHSQTESPHGMQMYPFPNMGSRGYPIRQDDLPDAITPTTEWSDLLGGGLDTVTPMSETPLSVDSTTPATNSSPSPNIEIQAYQLPQSREYSFSADISTQAPATEADETFEPCSSAMQGHAHGRPESTSSNYIERLLERLDGTNPWAALEFHISRIKYNYSHVVYVAPVTQETRHRLLDVALESPICVVTRTNAQSRNHKNKNADQLIPEGFLLPSTAVLDFFVRVYAFEHARYYWAEQPGPLDINDLAAGHTTNTIALLIFAKGAEAILQEDAQHLSTCLAEAGSTTLTRHPIYNIDNTVMLRQAFLWVSISLWTGSRYRNQDAVALEVSYSSVGISPFDTVVVNLIVIYWKEVTRNTAVNFADIRRLS